MRASSILAVALLAPPRGAAGDSCEVALDTACKPWKDTAACETCANATAHRQDMKAAGCTIPEVESLCSGTGPAPSPPAPPAADKNMKLVSFTPNASAGTLCGDGTPAGYHFKAATSEATADKWLFWFQGGSNPTSSAWPQSTSPIAANFGWNKGGFNFGAWNQVYFMTCSSDFRSGARLTRGPDGMYYQGHLHVVNALRQLKGQLATAANVLVGGCSGGGWSQVINIDYMAAQMPAGCDVRAWINSGLHFDVATYPDWVANGSSAVEGPMITKDEAVTLNSYVDESCRAAYGDDWYKCIGFDHAFPYITTPSFVAQAQFDKHQLADRVGLPDGALKSNTRKWSTPVRDYVAYFGRRMLDVFVPLLSNRSHDQSGALLMPSCLDHCIATEIGAPESISPAAPAASTTALSLFNAWYSRTLAEKDAIAIDACASSSPLPCNAAANTAAAYSCVH